MKNYEKYADEIREYEGRNFCEDFVQRYILEPNNVKCMDTPCIKCHMLQTLWLLEEYKEPKQPKVDWSTVWLMEEYKEPETDWNKVEVDTPIFVRADEEEAWDRRYFAKYENGHVYAWVGGCTSWTEENASAWKYAELAENKKEPEVDWSKVKVDTPILVRDSKEGKWLKRYFAKFEDGKVYAWLGENTSYTAYAVAKWKYAKLAEDEEEPEIDWGKIEVDTPILVREYEEQDWVKRYFAKYEGGTVYAWRDGCTSWTENHMANWKFAKLAESEEE